MSAASIARALRGIRSSGGYLCRCPVPGHGKGRGDRNPSLLVKDGDCNVLVTCFGGCDRRDVLDELRRRGLLDEGSAGCSPVPLIEFEPDHRPDPEAMALWERSEPIAGTLGERYLVEHRGLTGWPFSARLRFIEDALYPPGKAYLPAMVALVEAPAGHGIAVQVTYLRRTDGARAPVTTPRMTVGALGYGAVRLEPPRAGVLGLAEGTETAIAATILTGVPCWSALGAKRMHRVRLPDDVRELHVFADNDDTGRAAAERTADVHTALGRRVVIRRPAPEFGDFADAALALATAERHVA